MCHVLLQVAQGQQGDSKMPEAVRQLNQEKLTTYETELSQVQQAFDIFNAMC